MREERQIWVPEGRAVDPEEEKRGGGLTDFRADLESALDEEDLEGYLVLVRSRDGGDLQCFGVKVEKEMRAMLNVLIKDSLTHVDILNNIIKECES